jgi:hypothetical protein
MQAAGRAQALEIHRLPGASAGEPLLGYAGGCIGSSKPPALNELFKGSNNDFCTT